MTGLLLDRSAVISPCGRYRYRLTRTLPGSTPGLAFVMLNPSTADAEVDDPTIRRCINFAAGTGGIVVVNLFALRATDPRELREHGSEAVGPENRFYLARVLTDSLAGGAQVVCAWGAHAQALSVGYLFELHARERGACLWCLGRTKSGAPRHPLYVRRNQPLEIFS